MGSEDREDLDDLEEREDRKEREDALRRDRAPFSGYDCRNLERLELGFYRKIRGSSP